VKLVGMNHPKSSLQIQTFKQTVSLSKSIFQFEQIGSCSTGFI